jgi:sensor histidine kinase YesM
MNSPKEIPHNKLPVLQIVIGLMCIISVIFQSIISYIDRETKFLNYAKDTILTIIAETIFCIVIYYLIVFFDSIFAKSKWKWLAYPAALIAGFITCLYVLYAIFLLQNHTYYPLHKMLESGRFRMHVSINMMAVIFIYAIIIILNFYQLIVEKSSYAEKLQKEFAQVRLQALKSQVNPHFLFNSLSVLSSLVRTDPESSEKFVVQLAKAYRYILDQKDTELVSLKEELDFLNAYFYLLEIRFENKITLKKNISISTEEWCLPPLSLQMLVENVVKHNKMSASHPLIIQLNTTDGNIEVTNNINPREDNLLSTGVGLDNIRKRIAYLTHKQISILQTNQSFTVHIPLLKNKN